MTVSAKPRILDSATRTRTKEESSLRIDKWLWRARFYRTRALAQSAAGSGLLRLNGMRVEKAAANVTVGDILTVPRRGKPVAVRIQALGVRRGPASEAQALYDLIGDRTLDTKSKAA